MKHSILVVDDEQSICSLLSLALKSQYDVTTATTEAECIRAVEGTAFDVVLLDLVVGPSDGLTILRQIKAHHPQVPVIIMTAFGSIKTSVEAMRNGAFTYLTKPLDIDELRVHISQALATNKLNDELEFLSDELKKQQRFDEIIGDSPKMQYVYDMIDRLKDVDSNVTITGESGTGKELVARAVHFAGRRRGERFVAINCAAIPENLLEEELFGHKKGAFTGAVQDKKGKFEVADGGTIFLDEIGDMPLSLQGKLLRIIQNKEITPLGSTQVRHVDVRILAATNRDLLARVKNGTFREDLYYRLNVISIEMPPLRERKEDIPLLCEHFIKKFNAEQNKAVCRISRQAMERIVGYDYPGNVRQLANIIEHAMILTQGEEIQTASLPTELRQQPTNETGEERDHFAGMTLREVERILIRQALKRNGQRRDMTARELGISVRTLQNKINEYHL